MRFLSFLFLFSCSLTGVDYLGHKKDYAKMPDKKIAKEIDTINFQLLLIQQKLKTAELRLKRHKGSVNTYKSKTSENAKNEILNYKTQKRLYNLEKHRALKVLKERRQKLFDLKNNTRSKNT